MTNLISDKNVLTSPKPVAIKASIAKGNTMNALIYHGAGKKSWEQTVKPVILRQPMQ